MNKEFVYENLMGPNCLLSIEELTDRLQITSDMRILDLGCGKGLTSIYLAQKYHAQIIAADLWEAPENNYERFKQLQVDDRVIPVFADANALPFAKGYFDVAVSVGAFNMFGANAGFMDEKLAPFLKPGGIIAVEIPGLKKDFFDDVPQELHPFWSEDINFYSVKWWRQLWEQSERIEVIEAFSLKCQKQAWTDWLKCDNPFAKRDIDMIAAEGGKYFDSIGLIARVKNI